MLLPIVAQVLLQDGLLAHSSRQAEITYLDVAVGIDEQVAGLHVPVYYVGSVDEVERTQGIVKHCYDMVFA